MNNVNDPLVQLKDIHLPPPVSWWPPAPGWWLVGVCLLGLLGWGGYLLWKFFRRGQYRREALAGLRRLRDADPGQRVLLEEVSRLLRRVAIVQYGREEVAPLCGDAWLRFLDRTGKTDQFSEGEGKALGTMLYQPEVAVDGERLCRIAESWIRGRR